MTNTALNKLINHFLTKHLYYSQNFATADYWVIGFLPSQSKEKGFLY